MLNYAPHGVIHLAFKSLSSNRSEISEKNILNTFPIGSHIYRGAYLEYLISNNKKKGY